VRTSDRTEPTMLKWPILDARSPPRVPSEDWFADDCDADDCDAGQSLPGPRNGRSTRREAQNAAEEVAGYEGRLAGIESKVSLLQGMVGFNLALTVAIVIRLFLP
jgi:hypothetical protein